MKKRWIVECGPCRLDEKWADQNTASQRWVNHNNARHNGKLVAILRKDWG